MRYKSSSIIVIIMIFFFESFLLPSSDRFDSFSDHPDS